MMEAWVYERLLDLADPFLQGTVWDTWCNVASAISSLWWVVVVIAIVIVITVIKR